MAAAGSCQTTLPT